MRLAARDFSDVLPLFTVEGFRWIPACKNKLEMKSPIYLTRIFPLLIPTSHCLPAVQKADSGPLVSVKGEYAT